jgi:hypothetical protein
VHLAAIGRGGYNEASRQRWGLGKRLERRSVVSGRKIENERPRDGESRGSARRHWGVVRDGHGGQTTRRAGRIRAGLALDRRGERQEGASVASEARVVGRNEQRMWKRRGRVARAVRTDR